MKIVLDIETNEKHNIIWMCATRNIETNEVKVWREASGLQEYLASCDLIIMHNGINFDCQVLKETWKVTMKLSQVCDTLVLSRLLNPSLDGGHSLDAWGQRLGFPKGDFDDWDSGWSQEMQDYCIQDTLVTQKLYEHLTYELKQQEFSTQSQELEHEVQAIITKQEQNGFKLDQVGALYLLSELKTKLDSIQVEMQRIFPAKVESNRISKLGKPLRDIVTEFNPGSRKQIAERLIEKGWKPTKHTEKGSVIVDETTLEGLDFPEAKAIAEYLMLQKRIAQIDSWLKAVGDDGRVHGRVITNGAISGRATHMSPNMAQVPNMDALYGKECRSLWTVEKGNALVGVDLAQLELRCLAHYMQDEEYTTTLLSGDIHEKNRQAAGLSTRNEAKRFGFAFLYGAGGKKIGEILGCSPTKGQATINRYLKAMPKLASLREKVERLATKGTIRGLDGRRLNIRSAHSAVNTLLQGAGAIIAKQWIITATKMLQRSKIPYRLVAWVHDEIQVEVEETYAESVGQICVEAAREAGRILGTRCPMDAEYHIGKNWSESH